MASTAVNGKGAIKESQNIHTVSDTPLKLQKPRPDCLCYDKENIAW